MDKKLILDFDRKQKSLKNKRTKDTTTNSSTRQPSSSSTLYSSPSFPVTNTNIKHKNKHAKLELPDVAKSSLANYRDRARERREGLNKDFELEPEDLRYSNPILGAQITNDTNQDDDEAQRRQQQIDESKYLGGDVEHTHLVKGLDFALLQKVKSDQQLAEKLAYDQAIGGELTLGDQSDSDEEEFKRQAIIAASTTAKSKSQLLDLEKLRKGQSTEIIPCKTALARRILNVLDEKWPQKSELFIPGRMTYVIPLDEDAEDTSVTTILRSKADTSDLDENASMNENEIALDKLIGIVARLRQQPSKRVHEQEKDLDINDYEY